MTSSQTSPSLPDAIQVGVIQFSRVAQTTFSLIRYPDRAQLQTQLQQLVNIGSQTNIADALDLLVTDMFFPGNGNRFNAPDVAIVITDGQANVRENDIEAAANLAKASGNTTAISCDEKLKMHVTC